jgi:hypothetical protein
MPVGMANTPVIFQNMMNKNMQDLIDWNSVIYINDIRIISVELEKYQ